MQVTTVLLPEPGRIVPHRGSGYVRSLALLHLAVAVSVVHGCGVQTGEATEERLRPVIVSERVECDSDDPALWIHPDDPARSLVLGTDKADVGGSVYAFTLDGRIDQELTVRGLSRPNNIDVAYGFTLGGRTIDIAVVTERNAMALRVFSLPDLRSIDDGGISVFDGDTLRAPMGIALYRRAGDGALFAIVSGKAGPENGYLQQYRLEDNGEGHVHGAKVREFGAFSGRKEIEAIAVDSELGYVYYSDEQAGIRKYHADPEAGDEQLAFFGTAGFAGDHEGIAIYKRDNGSGYILVSNQQAGQLEVFPREGTAGNPHHHPTVSVIPVSARDTDGLEVTAVPLGPRFPRGLLVLMSSDRTFYFYDWNDVESRILAEKVAPPSVRRSLTATLAGWMPWRR
jgi:3-phytase